MMGEEALAKQPLTRAQIALVVHPPVLLLVVFVALALLVEPGAWRDSPPVVEYLFEGIVMGLLAAWSMGLVELARHLVKRRAA